MTSLLQTHIYKYKRPPSSHSLTRRRTDTVATRYHTTIVPRLLSCISRFVQCKKQGQNAIAHACGRVCRWWDTYITPQSRQDCYRVYHASSAAKTRTKRHCACVWTGLQMVGHVYHTTIVPRLLSCISRFIHGKNKDKAPLRMRVDAFADGGTHISTHNRAKTDHLYIRTKNKDKCHCACVWTGLQMVGHVYRTTIVLIVLSCILRFIHGKNKGKTPWRMRVDGFADGGTRISNHNRADRAIVYITLRSMQKQGQSAIAHACGRVCRWWDTYLQSHSYFVLHVLSLSLFRESHCLFV